MKKLLKSNGVTLAETLVAAGVLALFVAIAAAGLASAWASGGQIASSGRAAALGSDVMEIVCGELRYGSNFGGGGDSITLDSSSYGENCTITLDGGELVVISGSEFYRPLGSVVYGDLAVGALTFTIGGPSVDISVEIVDKSGSPLWKNSAAVVPLCNKLAA